MSHIDLKALTGQHVVARFENLLVKCKVMDTKMSYGHPRILVTPDSGYGLQWIALSRAVVGARNGQNGAEHGRGA